MRMGQYARNHVEVTANMGAVEGKMLNDGMSQPPPDRFQECVLIVDFGSQYSRLIARRVRELKVYCEIVSHEVSWDSVAQTNIKGVILSGGPASVYAPEAPLAPNWLYEKDLPVLGICYGMQVLAHPDLELPTGASIFDLLRRHLLPITVFGSGRTDLVQKVGKN